MDHQAFFIAVAGAFLRSVGLFCAVLAPVPPERSILLPDPLGQTKNGLRPEGTKAVRP
jgi:hypothetical protein